ncbi:MAG: glycosyltransferase, partial [Bryobacteraceae bacterium]
MQIISALRQAGHKVTFSMPLDNFIAKKNAERILPQLSKDEIWACEHFFEPDVVLNRVQPEMAITCNVNTFQTVPRFSREIVQILDFYGPLQFEGLLLEASDYEAATQDAPGLESRCRDLVEKIRQMDYLITVSERQKYFWSAYCTLAGFSFSELNVLVCPVAFEVPKVERNIAPNLTVVYSGGFYPWQKPDRFLRAAASILEEIDGAILHIFGGPHVGLPNTAEVNRLLEALQRFRCVKYHGYRPIEELTATLSTAWCALELMERNLERELAITGRTVEFLSAGVPVIYNDYSTLSRFIEQYNAGWTLSTAGEPESALRSVFEELLQGGTPLVEKLSTNARQMAASEFVAERSMAPLIELCEKPATKRRQTSQARNFRRSSVGNSLGRVLVISPDAINGALLELRIRNPFRALQRQGYIDAVTVTDASFSSLKHDKSSYDVIVTQRAIAEFIYRLFDNLALPFALDTDDNMLARAAYRRDRLETELILGLQRCTALTVPNPKLLRGLGKYSGMELAGKAFITPNSLPFPQDASSRPPAQPSQIVWIQSDIAALTKSRESIVRAVGDFSERYELPVVLIGKNVLERPRFKHQIVTGQIDFTSNLQMLEFGPASIGVAPLETDADDETLDFIAGKSDLKILLFAGYGHPGVYSAAPPYSDSALAAGLSLVGNSYEEWSEALEYQYREGWKHIPEVTARIRSERGSDRVARESWLPALQPCVLPNPVRSLDLYEAFSGSIRMNDAPVRLAAYLAANNDVFEHCMRHQDFSAWMHYRSSGYSENRHLVHAPEAQQKFLEELTREST